MATTPRIDRVAGNRRFLATFALSVTLCVTYFVAGKLGLYLATVNPSATAVWAPTGIALAAFLLWGYRVWPGILLGALLVNITTAGTAATSLGIAVGNTLEGLLGAYLINRFAHGLQVFSRLTDIVRFVVLAGLFSTALSASIGVTTLVLGGFAASAQAPSLWLTWWVGDIVGALVVAPLLVLWAVSPPAAWTRQRAAEAVLILLAVLLVNLTVFGGLFPGFIRNAPLSFLCLLPILWAAFRLGPRETMAATVLSSGIAIWGTLRGFGPFAGASADEALLLLQAYSGIIAVLAVILVAVVDERRRADAAHEQLLRREQAARAQAESNAERVARLQSVTAALSEALSASQLADIILTQGVQALGASSGMLVMLDEEAAELVSLGTVGYSAESAAPYRRFPVQSATPLAEAVRSGQMLALETTAQRIARFPHLGAQPGPAGLGALACLPLSIEQRVIGGLSLSFREDRQLTPDEFGLMHAFAHLSAQALERMRLFESEQKARAQAETAHERLALLAEASSVLASSLDHRATLSQVAHLLVPRHADWCALHIVAEDGSPQQLELAHVDPTKIEFVAELNRRYPPGPLAAGGLLQVIKTGRSEYMAAIPEALRPASARDEEYSRLISTLGLKSYLIVPLLAHDKVLGAISLATAESGRHFEASDVAFIEELARRAALAIDNARLYGEAQHMNADLEQRVLQRTAQVQAANQLLETGISERTRAQAVLQESEERLRLLVEGVRDYAIYMLDPDGRVMSWNEGAQRIKGYTAGEIIGRHFSLFYLPQDIRDGNPARILRIAEAEGRAEEVGWRVRKDGSRFWADVVITPLRDAHGQLRGFSKVTRDSTERKRAEDALQQANSELERRVQARTAELEHANQELGAGINDLMERNRAIGQLSEMGALLQGCLDSAEAYKVISQYGQRLFPLDAGALYLFTPTRDLLEPAAVWGDPLLAQQMFVPNDCWALRRGHMHVVQDTSASPLCEHVRGHSGTPDAELSAAATVRELVVLTPGAELSAAATVRELVVFAPGAELSAAATVRELVVFAPGARGPRPLSYLCVPLSAQGETLGVLHLRRDAIRSGQPSGEISEAEQHLVGAMVEQSALALSNLKLREILRVQSIRDPLTGLFNRRYMEETLEREIHHAARQHHPIGIALVDIDRFKQFNDRFGHQVGDIVLRAVGDFLNANVRGEDIACRYGGEEFMLILQEASLEDTRKRAEQLRITIKNALAEPYRERFGTISVSIGIAVFPEHGITPAKLIRAADRALYRAKAAGRDRVLAGSSLSEE